VGGRRSGIGGCEWTQLLCCCSPAHRSLTLDSGTEYEPLLFVQVEVVRRMSGFGEFDALGSSRRVSLSFPVSLLLLFIEAPANLIPRFFSERIGRFSKSIWTKIDFPETFKHLRVEISDVGPHHSSVTLSFPLFPFTFLPSPRISSPSLLPYLSLPAGPSTTSSPSPPSNSATSKPSPSPARLLPSPSSLLLLSDTNLLPPTTSVL